MTDRSLPILRCKEGGPGFRAQGRLRRAHPPDLLLVTPGIRFAGLDGPADDQRRVATPATALADGSDLLVIGRPLTRAKDPDEALARLSDALEA